MKKPAPKAQPKPELTYELEGAPPTLYVIRHAPSGTWWRAEGGGYTQSLLAAGTFSEAEAKRWAANRPDDDVPMLLTDAVRAHVADSNPAVLQAIAALGGR